ncbi:hypothetical protein EHW99_0113 [Erwinia amylovora]|nr:hypothetical protein EHX00_0113 [Erwinia amylovora]QJQ56518.1 hypothetical protein EHW99_0113 [Erwinia amylovora]QJQ60217.1 hypothetical protein EHW98_0113 [Erwinia amylovora]QJQ64019.1 hypothetical protein EHW96_0113 [Erwinia amylovora]QJQ67718.1 hypothetical protein EGZ89_0113 [Erwinia amylovora]
MIIRHESFFYPFAKLSAANYSLLASQRKVS